MTPEEYARMKHNKQQMEYYYRNHEEQKARHAETARRWRKNNPEAAKAQRKKYFEKNKERIMQQRKEYYQRNRERILEHQRQKRYEKNNFSPAADTVTGNPCGSRP